MSFCKRELRLCCIIGSFCLMISSFFGCSIVGPRAISKGRADYNEAIAQTDDQQMLLAIIHHRYGETISMLAVSSVTANIRITASTDVEIGYGRDSGYAGNLIPFSAGAAYEENPTISYVPVQSEQYLRQMMSPIPLDILIMISRSSTWPIVPFTLLVSRVNNIRNPNFLKPPMVKPDTRFTRFVELIMELNDVGCFHWVEDSREAIEHSMLIRDYTPSYSKKVRELMSMLELPMPNDESRDIVIPIHFAVKDKKVFGIAVETRSVFDLINIIAASIEVPEEHADSGLANTYPPKGLSGSKIHIRCSERKPKNASVAVKYLGSWFYIDGRDQHTKMIFRLLSTLWSVRIGEEAKVQAAPVLTVPVSR